MSNALQCSSPWYGLNDEDALPANRFLHIHSSFWAEEKTKAAVKLNKVSHSFIRPTNPLHICFFFFFTTVPFSFTAEP